MDWRDEIKGIVNDYVELKTKLSTTLSEVLSELRVSPFEISSTNELVELSPLTWKVTLGLPNVGRVQFSISVNDITEGREDEAGYPMPESIPEDPKEAFKKCIIKKVSELLKV